MMKRVICFALILILSFSMMPIAHATELVNEEIIYFEDGTSIVVTIDVPSRSIYAQNGKKTISGRAQDGTLVWKAELTATYIYTGTSATCTQSNISVTVYVNTWYEISKSASKSGATATGSVTMGRKLAGITVENKTYNTSLTCSPTGELS